MKKLSFEVLARVFAALIVVMCFVLLIVVDLMFDDTTWFNTYKYVCGVLLFLIGGGIIINNIKNNR